MFKPFDRVMLELALFYTILIALLLVLTDCSNNVAPTKKKLVPVMTHPLMEAGCAIPATQHENFELIDCLISDGRVSCFFLGELNGRRCIGIALSEDCMTYKVVWAGCEGLLLQEIDE